MIDTKRRGEIRGAVSAHRTTAIRLRNQHVDGGMKTLLTRNVFFPLDDVDHFFLANVDTDRSKDQEGRWLDYAEIVLDSAVRGLQSIQREIDGSGGAEKIRPI